MSWSADYRIGDLTDIQTGKLNANAAVKDGKYPFFTCARETSRIDTFSFSGESVLVAGNGDLNVKYYKGDFDAYQRTYVIQSNNTEILNTRYLFYFLDTKLESLRNASIGGVIKYIKIGHLTDLVIKLPDLRTQQQIVAVLDKAQSLIRKREQSIQLLDELLKATFLDMFGDPVLNEKGWITKPLRDVLNKIDAGWSPMCESFPRSSPKQWAVLKQSAISKRFFDPLENKKLPEGTKIRKEILARKGDLLFSRKNSSSFIGATVFLQEDYEKLLLPDTIFNLRYDKSKVTGIYLNYLFNDNSFRLIIQGLKSGSASSMPNISQNKLLGLEFPLPPHQMQLDFDKVVQKIQSTKNYYSQSSLEFENLFQSLLQDAFEGKLKLEEDNLALQNAKKKVKWFDEQLNQIVENSAAAQLQKKLDKLSGQFSTLKRIEEIEQRLNKLNAPSLDKISELQQKLEKLQTPNLKYLKSFETFQKLEQDDLIKKVTDNKPFKIKSFEEFVKSKEEEKITKQIQEDNDPVLRFIGEDQIGKATISNYSINVARVIHEYFGQKEFNLQTLEDVLVNNYALAVRQSDLKKDLFRIFEEFIISKLNGFFAFDDMRSQMKKDLFNPSFEILQEFVETGLKKKSIQQRFIAEFKHPEKWHPSNVLDSRSDIEKYIAENSNRVYLILNQSENENK